MACAGLAARAETHSPSRSFKKSLNPGDKSFGRCRDQHCPALFLPTMAMIQGVMNHFVDFLSRVIGYFVDKVALRNQSGLDPGEMPKAIWVMGMNARPSGLMALFSSHPPMAQRLDTISRCATA